MFLKQATQEDLEMQKIAIGAMLALGLSVVGTAQSQKDPSPQTDPQIIIAPSPDSPDLMQALTRYDNVQYNWDSTHEVTFGIKFYAGQFTSTPTPGVTLNNFNLFERSRALFYARRRLKLDISIEVGGVKNGRAGECLFTEKDIQAWVERVAQIILNVYRIGGRVNSIAIETALGDYQACGYSTIGIGIRIAEITKRLQVYVIQKLLEMCRIDPNLPAMNLLVGDIEPYPTAAATTHYVYLTAVNNFRAKDTYRPLVSCAEGLGPEQSFEPLAYYDLDIDTTRATDDVALGVAVATIRNLVSLFADPVTGRVSQLGVIITGDDSHSSATDTDEYFANRFVLKLIRYKNSGVLGMAGRLVNQSWMATTKKVQDPVSHNWFPIKDVPHTAPDEGPTLTNLAKHALNCRNDLVDCPAFPYAK